MTNARNTQSAALIAAAGDPDIRATTSAALIAAAGDPDIRATTSAALVLGEVGTSIDLTQSAALILAQVGTALRITESAILALVELAPPCLTFQAYCWRIERTDGTVFTFTSHDESIYIRGESYSPCYSLSASAYQLSSELGETDNLDISGLISDTAISEADLFAGAFDGASVIVYLVNHVTSPVVTRTLATGTAGRLQHGNTGYKFEVVTDSQKLQTKALLQQVTPTCRWKLGSPNVTGSPGCGVDLEALRVSGTVTAVSGVHTFRQSSRRVFTDTSRSEADDYFALGVLTWTTGANAGLSVEVKDFASDTFTLWQELRGAIQIGDQYTVVPGCDKLAATCITKFANFDNFGGFPFLPGRDTIQRRADSD